ncbi:MAG TPA: hypothetical protein VFI29_09145 [Hanamia sp.]|nr:hypothetical protein [Hanamia sp.]
MEIKNVIVLVCFGALLSLSCNGQKQSTNISTDSSNCFDKKLPEYQISSCISNLLESVVKSNSQFYDQKKYFYSLTLKKGDNQKYLNITPEEWHSATNMDYTGILKVRGVTFLCRGDFDKDSLFKKESSTFVRVKLKQSKDSADMLPFFTEPSLDGVFSDCKGLPIYVEVYTKGKILGFEKKLHHMNE